MTDHATPNLPSRDFEGTLQFYQKLGFDTEFRDDGWMILNRGDAKLEFFPHPELVPSTSSFSCCIITSLFRNADVPDSPTAPS